MARGRVPEHRDGVYVSECVLVGVVCCTGVEGGDVGGEEDQAVVSELRGQFVTEVD